VRVLPYGDRAVLVELPLDADVLAWRRGIEQLAIAEIDELVPGERTLLLRLNRPVDVPSFAERLAQAAPASAPAKQAAELMLDVRYDGADLAEVARLVGASPDDVIAWHSAARYTVAFCGFAPGFAYLHGLDPRLQVPRLATPRARVPAGAVAIAARYASVYPRPSPGGWRLLGSTDAVLWDVARTPPALLPPGTAVRFRPA
jgi:KipI family sensor histidine kinase inhibitor